MIISFGSAAIISGILCFLSRLYLKDDGNTGFVLGLLQLQGWLGISICLWGSWEIIYTRIDLNRFAADPLYLVSLLAGGLLNIFSGALLGFSMIQRLTLVQVPQAAPAGAGSLRLKLIKLQTGICYICCSLGLWLVFYGLAG